MTGRFISLYSGIFSKPTAGFAMLLCALVLLAACTPRPNLPQTQTATGNQQAWPQLLPTTALAQTAAAPVILTENNIASVSTRASNLRARAARLSRTPVLTRGERSRLEQAIARNAAR